MGLVYRNRFIINQRGASIDIDNTTEEEKIKISHRSGSNISMTNVTNSELATTNKQTLVIRDSYDTVGNDRSEFTVKNNTDQTGENTYTLNGYIDSTQLDAFTTWKSLYTPIAIYNSKFNPSGRGFIAFPTTYTGATSTAGVHIKNPVLDQQVLVVENTFHGYNGIPLRTSKGDDVVAYSKVIDRGQTKAAQFRNITSTDILNSAGEKGSKAPGVLEWGPDKSAATEGSPAGSYDIGSTILMNISSLLIPEQQMGDFGDTIEFSKRNKFEHVGAEFNDFPSCRIDEEGRSQPFEMLVSQTGTYKNHDYIPLVEEIDNASNFPCGNDDGIVGNRFSRVVGSGGINLKTSGTTELGGTILKVGFKQVNINASHGIQIGSERGIEIQSLKTITLRTNRQVYIENSLGVKHNVIVGGGVYVEGEIYCQHITAPLEVHQTQDTTVFGKFATDYDRRLVIGEVNYDGQWFNVYAKASDDLLVTYPHSHHHNGIPMRLTQKNKDVRQLAIDEHIDEHNIAVQSLPQIHERKTAQIIV